LVLPFDKIAAQRAVDVFDRLRLPDVTGKLLLKDAAGDCFLEIVRAQALKYGPRQQKNCTDRYEEKARPVWSEP
jgi:hypothetical protein